MGNISTINLTFKLFRYPNEVDTVTWTWNQQHGAKSILWLTLAQPFSRACIEYLPVYTPNSDEIEDPKLYAANVREVMAKGKSIFLETDAKKKTDSKFVCY